MLLVLKAELVVFHLNDLLIYNVVSLIVGPISLIFFVVCEYVLRSERGRQPNGHPISRPSVLEWLKQRSWLGALWRRSKFWIALVITIASQALLVWAYLAFNSFVRHHPHPFHQRDCSDSPHYRRSTPPHILFSSPSFLWHTYLCSFLSHLLSIKLKALEPNILRPRGENTHSSSRSTYSHGFYCCSPPSPLRGHKLAACTL